MLEVVLVCLEDDAFTTHSASVYICEMLDLGWNFRHICRLDVPSQPQHFPPRRKRVPHLHRPVIGLSKYRLRMPGPAIQFSAERSGVGRLRAWLFCDARAEKCHILMSKTVEMESTFPPTSALMVFGGIIRVVGILVTSLMQT